MGVIATNKNEIRFYYSSLSSIGKQAMAFILASDKKVLAIDVSKTKVTGTQWVELANGLGMEVYQLIDTDVQGPEDSTRIISPSPTWAMYCAVCGFW